MKYRSKPNVVEAVQFKEEPHPILMQWVKECNDLGYFGQMLYTSKDGDWIIKDGETFSVCSDEEFRRKYEACE